MLNWLQEVEMNSLNYKLYYNNKYTGAKHAFDTTRKSKHIAEALGEGNTVDPEDITTNNWLDLSDHWIARTISPRYYRALQMGDSPLSSSNGFSWDKGIWEMALNSTAGVMAAAETAINNKISGSLSSGLHHADNEGGMGFCTVNGLAVTAHYLYEGVGLDHITILDFDAHNGGGTVHSLRALELDNVVDQFDLSTNTFDSYREDDNHTIAITDNDDDYLNTVDVILETMNQDTDIVLYNAGTDPYPTISHSALEERDRIVFQHCLENDIPCAFVLAGGYTWGQEMDSLVQSHVNTINAAHEAKMDLEIVKL
jgi:acetoin utilization deacetylase AcuC-like enzyme